MTEQFQSSIDPGLFQGGDILMEILKIAKFSKNEEKQKMKRSQDGACSTSYPTGNQVDGLPLVAVIDLASFAERRPGHLVLHPSKGSSFDVRVLDSSR